jgi:hypothetical protein
VAQFPNNKKKIMFAFCMTNKIQLNKLQRPIATQIQALNPIAKRALALCAN